MDRFRSRLSGFSRSACVAVLVALVGEGACGGAQMVTWVPSPDRAQGLPATVEALLALSDEQISQRPVSVDRVDRGLAALEAATSLAIDSPFELHWRLARAYFLVAEQLPLKGPGQGYTALGVTHGGQAVAFAADRVEGHYYLALNMAKTVEANADIEKLKPMLKVAKRAVTIDPAFDAAGPLRLVGKVYMMAPEWPTSVGDRDEAVDVLKRAVKLAPTSMNRLFLGEALYHIDEFDKAIAHLRRALKTGGADGLEERWRDEGKGYLMRMGAFD